MEISLEWLSEFVDVPAVPELSEKLAKAGIEVEEVRDPAAKVRGVVVGLVEACEKHPDADKLHVCTVFDGEARRQVVCGAANVALGQRVPYAKLGAVLPGGTIEPRTLRGVESAGMLCSKEDLGLEQKSDGLWDLGPAAQVGVDVFEQTKIGPTLVLAITPNRPDLLSHVGVAREVAAAMGKKMKTPTWRVTEKGPEATTLARVVVDDAAGCRRYLARVVRNLKVGPSPAWLKTRLEQIGQRSINNVVDATNYVLFELGHPLHAFDLGRIDSEAGLPTVHVRRAKEGESAKTLDGNVTKLAADDLLIADVRGPLALAGVMGGADSEVTGTTTNVLLESAYFDPTRVRRTARRHGMRTEASYRFERGADPGIVQKAVDRCAQLLSEIAGGEVAKGTLEVTQKSEPPRDINLRLDRVRRLLGITLTAEAVAQLLEPLEVRCSARNETSLRFQAPTFRPDLTREIDLIEELVRRHGYERVPERLPDTSGPYQAEPGERNLRAEARGPLLAAGCTEVVTFGFGSPAHMSALAPDAGEPLRIVNPLGEELSALRTTLLSGLLGVLAHNQRHGTKDVRIFEVGTVIRRRPASAEVVADERERDLPQESLRAGVLLAGGRAGGRWYERGEGVDFSDLAGVVDTLCEAFAPKSPVRRVAGAAVDLPRVTNPFCTASLVSGETALGYAGQLVPELCDRFGVQGPVYVAEVDLALLAAESRVIVAESLPRFPGTRRDLAVVAPRALAAEQVRAFLADHAGGELGRDVVERVRLFDVYTGKPIPESHVSLAFAIEYRSRERTLTDAEVGDAFESVQRALKETFDVEVRSA